MDFGQIHRLQKDLRKARDRINKFRNERDRVIQAIDQEKDGKKQNDEYVKVVLDRLKNQFDSNDEYSLEIGSSTDGGEHKLSGNSLQRITYNNLEF